MRNSLSEQQRHRELGRRKAGIVNRTFLAGGTVASVGVAAFLAVSNHHAAGATVTTPTVTPSATPTTTSTGPAATPSTAATISTPTTTATQAPAAISPSSNPPQAVTQGS